jgi:hypothetical protein
MSECSALDLVMDEDVDWNDSEDDEECANDTHNDDIREPLDVAQVEDEDDGELDDLDESDHSITMDTSSSPSNPTTSLPTFSEPVGPSLPYLASTATPLEFFLMVGSDFFAYLAKESNRYAQQKPPQLSYKWYDTTAEELMLMIGMIFAMGINVQPELADYWKNDSILGAPGITRGMPVLRFKALLSVLHLNDNCTALPRGHAQFDKLYKVRPFLDRLRKNFLRCYHPHRENSIDEAMVGFKGRSTLKQYMPMKPTKRGYKVWCRCDAKNGYLCDIRIYIGAEGTTVNSLGSKVVLDLAENLFHKGYHLYFDNFFSSVELADELLTHQTGMIATTRANRRRFPRELRKVSQERGHTKSLMVGNVECFAWQDKKQVNFLNTITDPQKKTTVKRKKKDGSSINVKCPESVKLYNANMGGVDNADAKRKVYSCSRRSKKWWMRIFYFGLDVAVVNAHIVHQNTPNCPKITQKEFRMELAKELLSMHSVRKILGSRTVDGGPSRYIERHWPTKLEKSLHCRICSQAKTRRRTSYGCKQCSSDQPVPLCVVLCFRLYHTKN